MYKYHHSELSQSMKTPVFKYRKGRNKRKFNAGSPSGKPTSDGTVCVTLHINNTKYGPYATDIYCFRAVWDDRQLEKPRKPSQEIQQRIDAAQALSEQLLVYAIELKKVYASLQYQCQIEGDQAPIDGKMVMGAMHASRKRQDDETTNRLRTLGVKQVSDYITLPELYKEFMEARKRDIQDNRHKRVEGQISQSTYNTYPKRWSMIEAFLKHNGRRDIPVLSIKAMWGEKLKDFLKTYKQKNSKPYEMASINKALSMMKMLMSFAKKQGHTDKMPLDELSCRANSSAKPKPLTEDQMQLLETVQLPERLRWICDSWLVAAELCLHYSDYQKLPYMKVLTDQKGKRYIQHDRSKQRSDGLLQTVDITPRAERIIAKYGVNKLCYKSSGEFSNALKMIAMRADLLDSQNNIIPLQFGQGRDTGLTSRVIRGANGLQLTKMAGWANPRVANRYIGLDLEIVQAFAN